MGILDALRKDIDEVENKVEETQPSVATQAPVEQEAPKESVEETQPVTVDRSAFNCPDCGGEGLTADQTARCATCGGTGKVS